MVACEPPRDDPPPSFASPTGRHANAARCVLYSLNFGDIMRLRALDPDLGGVRGLVVDAARTVAGVGAWGVLLCANTLHLFAEAGEEAVSVSVIHIAAATAKAVNAEDLRTVCLLGTRPTMERDLYPTRLSAAGITTLILEADDRAFIDHSILHELVQKVFRPEVKSRFLSIMAELGRRGAESIVLGCTEIPLMIKPDETDLPMFDTLHIHAQAAVDFALGART